jgi:hypothetical protein
MSTGLDSKTHIRHKGQFEVKKKSDGRTPSLFNIMYKLILLFIYLVELGIV